MSNLREYPRFSVGEYARRYSSARRMMADRNLDVLVIYGNSSNSLHGQANVHYLSNLLGRHDAYLIFPAESEAKLLVEVYNHIPTARAMSVIKDTGWAGTDSSLTLAKELIGGGYEGAKVGLVGRIPYQVHSRLVKELPNAAFTDVTRSFSELRSVKSEEELEWVRKGAAFTDHAMEALEREVHAGMREFELARVIEGAYMNDGGQYHFFYIGSTPMGNPSVCVPSQHLSNRLLEKGDAIITEVSVSWWGYSGQIHRPIAVSSQPNDDYRRLYDVALQAYERLAKVIRDGATEAEVLDAADIIDDSGFSIYDGLIHGFGVDLQPPDLRTKKTSHHPPGGFVFRRNMTVVIQPNVISKDERMGIQLGNLMLVTENGTIPLQKYPVKFVVSS
jgi:Xaa-Pro dipeptidase